MLKQAERIPQTEFETTAQIASVPVSDTFAAFFSFAKRQYPIIIFLTAVIFALGLVYVYSTPPSFTAQSTMIIDTRKIQLFQQSILSDVGVDSATVESQVEILRSDKIALSIIKDLRLTEDPEFVGKGGGLISAVIGSVLNPFSMFEADRVLSEFELTQGALRKFEDLLTVKRLGLTYVIEIGFRSRNPERAAQIANAIVDAYLVDQLEAKYQATRRASTWLQERLRELRGQASAAERAVVEFKAQNNIVDTGGRLMNEQQLAEINSQLVLARAQTAEAQARQERIESIIRSGVPDATVTDALRNDVIVRLRQQYADISKREADWSARYGRDHLAVVNLRNEMREIRRAILDELGRIAETYKSDYAIAKAREEAVRQSLADVVSQSQTTSQAQVALRDLESTAQTFRALYDNFLQRYMESLQQQSFPITEARQITVAAPPLRSSHPKVLLILAVSLAAGAAAGVGLALTREFLDRVIRTTEQIERAINIECIAIIPVARTGDEQPPAAPVVKEKEKGTGKDGGFGPKTIVRTQGLLWNVVDAPFSRFTEGVRSIKVAIDINGLSRKNHVVGITSAQPNEGKSTVATSLAQLIAHTGQRAILLDGDLRNPSLTRLLAPSASAGIIEVITKKTQLYEAIWTDPSTMLDFVPTVLKNRLPHTNEIMASDAMKDMIVKLRQMYDYVIIDLPPLAPVVDVRSSVHLVDSFVFVVEWGKTKIDDVTYSLRRSPNIQEHILGVVLNKVNMGVFNRYEAHRGSYYQNKYYSRYGYVE
jgi:succinoglycan biosynthesis transport protein ExoP